MTGKQRLVIFNSEMNRPCTDSISVIMNDYVLLPHRFQCNQQCEKETRTLNSFDILRERVSLTHVNCKHLWVFLSLHINLHEYNTAAKAWQNGISIWNSQI